MLEKHLGNQGVPANGMMTPHHHKLNLDFFLVFHDKCYHMQSLGYIYVTASQTNIREFKHPLIKKTLMERLKASSDSPLSPFFCLVQL